jgi:hypothetical protein
MAVNGTDIVEQLRGRIRFYHVGDPVRKDLERACEEIGELRVREVLMQALIDEAATRNDAASVGGWLNEQGIKLLPWQRKRLGLGVET